jgi:hypothetical protein
MPDEDAKSPEEPEEGPAWEFRKEFKISGQMKEVIQLSMNAAESELKVLRRKLEKLHYGS